MDQRRAAFFFYCLDWLFRAKGPWDFVCEPALDGRDFQLGMPPPTSFDGTGPECRRETRMIPE